MLLRIHHETTFRYSESVTDSYMEARLRPWSDADQSCADYALTTSPATRISSCRTPFARVEFFNLYTPHDSLTLTSEATVMTMPRNTFERLDLQGNDWPLLRAPEVRHRFWEYLQLPTDPYVARAAERLVAQIRGNAGESLASFMIALNRHVHCSYTYDPRATEVTTPLTEVLAHRRGVCQDFAHLTLAVARTAGIPARYLSGYLHVEPPREGNGAMHAWIEAYLPNAGWIGFDPTHGLLVDHHYVKVAVGREYSDVPPTRGMYRGPREHEMSVRVKVFEVPADETNTGSLRREGGLPSERMPSSGIRRHREPQSAAGRGATDRLDRSTRPRAASDEPRAAGRQMDHRVVTQRC